MDLWLLGACFILSNPPNYRRIKLDRDLKNKICLTALDPSISSPSSLFPLPPHHLLTFNGILSPFSQPQKLFSLKKFIKARVHKIYKYNTHTNEKMPILALILYIQKMSLNALNSFNFAIVSISFTFSFLLLFNMLRFVNSLIKICSVSKFPDPIFFERGWLSTKSFRFFGCNQMYFCIIRKLGDLV